MSHTYSSMRIHVVFSTKERRKRLREELQPKLWAYIAGIARHHELEAIKIGGAEDHCHALILLPAPMPLSKAVQTLKGCSSKWLNDTGVGGANFAWQEGYGAFSVSASQTDDVIAYINNQPEHHKKRNYEEEFLELLKRYGIAYHPAHVLGQVGRPSGTWSLLPAYPALKRWAKLGRPFGTGIRPNLKARIHAKLL